MEFLKKFHASIVKSFFWVFLFLFCLHQVSGYAASSRYSFRNPAPVNYTVILPDSLSAESTSLLWLTAYENGDSAKEFKIGNRIVAQVAEPLRITNLLSGTSLKIARKFSDNFFVLEATNALTALIEAQKLLGSNDVISIEPVVKRNLIRHWQYALQPNDSYFAQQWNLENRASNGAPLGVDINVRSGWSIATGEGQLIAISDGGIEITHPELLPNSSSLHHFNFNTLVADGSPASPYEVHGTEVAGIAVARANNRRGIAGVAPRAKFASWVIFDSNGQAVSSERLADMFQYYSNAVFVQLHCWGFGGGSLNAPALIEQLAISNAVQFGRNGKGIVIVRSAGNNRRSGASANDDGYVNDPKVIAVAAIRSNGRVASYSNPGSIILVSAPSGDATYGFPNIFTTDLTGNNGLNPSNGTNDLGDYVYGNLGFSGTSAAAPHIAAITALMLSVNPELSYRDVQQILLISAKQYDSADPHIQTNGAGLKVSFNTGYGVPNAGLAVRLAQHWSNRQPLQTVVLSITNTVSIPEQSLRVRITGYNIPPSLSSIAALPSGLGPRPDKPTRNLQLVYVPNPLSPIPTNLAGKAALIARAWNFFDESISNCALAGAEFVIVHNNNTNNPNERIVMNVSDFAPIPSVFISYSDGIALKTQVQYEPETYARLELTAATYLFNVTNSMLCEHIGLRLRANHPRRGDLRITLQSPMGTVSVLQRTNYDNAAFPAEWTYYSTQHFYEQSAGIWRLQVSDEVLQNTGQLISASLIIFGVPIEDTNRNALADAWESAYGLSGASAGDDPDHDGWQNTLEQILNTNPVQPEPIMLNASIYNDSYLRLSWNGNLNQQYSVRYSTNIYRPMVNLTTIYGNFPETEFFFPLTPDAQGYFRVLKE